MSTVDTAKPSRRERRKAQTRAALVGAAQELLADDRGAEVSIQEITERADVGFGSFYNHFASKEALFEAAVVRALDDHSAWLDGILQGEDDAALVFATSLRLTGRLLRTAPTMAHVVKNALGPVLAAERGIAARARRDLTRAAEQGRLTIEDPDVALACTAGALVGVIHLLAARDDLVIESTTDLMVEHVLGMFGMPRDEARRLVSLPLPERG